MIKLNTSIDKKQLTKRLKEYILLAIKWLKKNALLVFFIIFAIAKFRWLDDIEEEHYLMGDIEKFEDDFFYSIIICEVIILMIPVAWHLKSLNPLDYLLAMVVYAIPGFFMFFLFQEIFMAVMLPLNRTEVKTYQYNDYWITHIEQVEYNDRKEYLINVKSVNKEYRTRGYFVMSTSDTTNYRERDTITLKFKTGRFGLRYDPSNEEETLIYRK